MKYYGIAGNNGFGVYDDYDRAINGLLYVRMPETKNFDKFQDAFYWARDIYNNRQHGSCDVDDIFEGTSSDIKLNWLLFKRDIRRLNIGA